MSNLLQAIHRAVNNPFLSNNTQTRAANRLQAMGEALENYLKYLFSGIEPEHFRGNENVEQIFSYLGGKNTPPDLMLRGGDAVEVKKIENKNAEIALNSSMPKAKLYADDPSLSHHCRTCEQWQEKDLIYAIGCIEEQRIKYLWLVYGDCFVAERQVYERVKTAISSGINNIPNVYFSETRELGRVNSVDPLGITYLRIRGMWGIENPNKIFEYLNVYDSTVDFQLMCLMRSEKFASFPPEDQAMLYQHGNIEINDVRINNPNNPAILLDAKLISYRS